MTRPNVSPLSPVNRRRFIELGTAASALSLSGCFSFLTSDYPTYTDWIRPSDGGFLTAYIDFSISAESPQAEQLLPVILPSEDDLDDTRYVPDLTELNGIGDPLVTWPLEIGGKVIGGASIGLAVSGLGYLIEPRQPTQGVTELLLANDVVVGTGEIGVTRAEQTLKSGTRDVFGDVKFEEVGGHRSFGLYRPITEGIDGITAVSESAVVIGDSRAQVETTIEAWRGDHRRAVDENGVFEQLIDAAGSGDIVAGWHDPARLDDYYIGEPANRPAGELISQTKNVLSSVSFSAESDEIEATFALEETALSTSTRNRLESQFGTSSRESAVSVSGNLATVTGVYSNDILDIEFIDAEETADSSGRATETPVSGTGEVPPAVAEAVPNNAFEFSYNEDKRTVRVNFVKDFEADEVTITTAETASENSTTTPGPVSYLTVYIDPDGDEVSVIVTVDEQSGVVAKKSFP